MKIDAQKFLRSFRYVRCWPTLPFTTQNRLIKQSLVAMGNTYKDLLNTRVAMAAVNKGFKLTALYATEPQYFNRHNEHMRFDQIVYYKWV